MLKSIGAGAGVVATANLPDWGEMTDLGPDDWEPVTPASANIQSPQTITYRGREVELVPTRGSCRDFLKATGKEDGVGLDLDGESGDGYCIARGEAPDNNAEDEIKEKAEFEVVGDNFHGFGSTKANYKARIGPSDLEDVAGGVFGARVTSCTLRSDPHIRMHDWHVPYEPTKRCREAYCEAFKGALEHEYHHAKDYDDFPPEFETWVANNKPRFYIKNGDHIRGELVQMAQRMTENQRLLSSYAHDRVSPTIINPCPVCADCREVAGRTNWTYRDVTTLKLDVDTEVNFDIVITDPDEYDVEEETLSVESIYDAEFHLDQVPPSYVRRVQGGINALQSSMDRIRAVRRKIQQGSLSDGFITTAKAFLGRQGSDVDFVSDGQAPLLWMSRNDGSVTGTLRANEIKQTTEYNDCGDLPEDNTEEEQILTRAKEKIDVGDIDSTAFATLSPTDNTMSCFWPDVDVTGVQTQYFYRCERDGGETELVPDQNEFQDSFLGMFSGEGETEGWTVWGGAPDMMRYHIEQVADDKKACGEADLRDLVSIGTGNKAGFYTPRAAVGSDDVAQLFDEQSSVGGIPKPIQEQVMSRPNPFWVIDECQDHTFRSTTDTRELYIRPSLKSSPDPYHADTERWKGSQQTVDAGEITVDVTLTTETTENESYGRINCGFV